jgi:hypothetical protein
MALRQFQYLGLYINLLLGPTGCTRKAKASCAR